MEPHKHETITSCESWPQNLIYTLSLDNKHCPLSGDRGFVDDEENVLEAPRCTKEQKVNMLEMLLGQIANYASIISRYTIVINSTSIDSILQAIRLHYCFQISNSHFLNFAGIKLQSDERPEDLYQRVVAFMEDNLLKP